MYSNYIYFFIANDNAVIWAVSQLYNKTVIGILTGWKNAGFAIQGKAQVPRQMTWVQLGTEFNLKMAAQLPKGLSHSFGLILPFLSGCLGPHDVSTVHKQNWLQGQKVGKMVLGADWLLHQACALLFGYPLPTDWSH